MTSANLGKLPIDPGAFAAQHIAGTALSAGLGCGATMAIATVNPIVGAVFGGVTYLITAAVSLVALKCLSVQNLMKYSSLINLGSLIVSVLLTTALTAAALTLFAVPFTIASLALIAFALAATGLVTIAAICFLQVQGFFAELSCSDEPCYL